MSSTFKPHLFDSSPLMSQSDFINHFLLHRLSLYSTELRSKTDGLFNPSTSLQTKQTKKKTQPFEWITALEKFKLGCCCSAAQGPSESKQAGRGKEGNRLSRWGQAERRDLQEVHLYWRQEVSHESGWELKPPDHLVKVPTRTHTYVLAAPSGPLCR